MSNKQQKYEIRLSVENGKIANAEMKAFGETGKKAFKDITDGASLMDKELGRMQSAIAGRLMAVIAPAALVAGARSVVSSIGAIGDAAQKAGQSIENLQALQYTGLQFGASVNVMTDAMIEFNKRVGEAQNGQGKLLETLKQYDIKLVDSNGRLRTTNDILRDYADKVRGAASQQEQLRMAVSAFGNNAGKEMVEVLAQGSDGLDRYAQKAREAGAVIREDLVVRAKELDDLFKKIWYTGEVNLKSGIFQALDKTIDLLKEVERTARLGTGAMKDLFDTVKARWGTGLFSRETANDLNRRLDRRAQEGAVEDLLAELGTPRTPAVPWIKKQEASRPMATALPISSKDRAAEEKAAADAEKKLRAVIELLKFRNEQMTRTNDEQEIYNQLRAAGTTLDTAAGQEIRKLVEEHQAYQNEIRKTKESTEALRRATDGFFERLIDGFADGKISAAELQQAVLQLFKEIMMARDSQTGVSLAGNIFGQISSGLGGFFKSIFGFAEGGIMTAAGPLPLRHYAAGGIAHSPQVSVYGERADDKPEAYVPLPDGRSIPVTMRGAGTVLNVEVINQAGVDVQPQMSGNGKSLQIMLRRQVAGMIRGGDMDAPLRERAGISRTLRES